MLAMTEQTRGSRRIASNRPLQLRCPDWQEFVRTYVRDISTGGMFIETEQAPPILSFIEVSVDLPDGDVLSLNARVVHVLSREQVGPSGTPGIGVEFQDVTPEARARIHALMRHVSQEQPRTASGVHSVPNTAPQRTPSQPNFQAVVIKPPSHSAAASAKEEKATLQRLTADLKAIGAKNDYEILGVDQRVDEATLRTAFIAQSKIYHPDLFAQYSSPEIRQVATQLFVRIKRAFTQISEKIKQRDPGAAAANLARALGTGHPGTSQTRAPLRSPLPPANEPGSVVALLADAKRHVTHKRYEEAQRTLEKAISIDPNHRDVKIWFYTVRARRLKLEGDDANALEHYRLVLELDEKNLEAAKELRATKETVVFGMRFKKD